MYEATKNPNAIPNDIFGNNPPTIPPTNAPTPIKMPAITPNNFIVGSEHKGKLPSTKSTINNSPK